MVLPMGTSASTSMRCRPVSVAITGRLCWRWRRATRHSPTPARVSVWSKGDQAVVVAVSLGKLAPLAAPQR